MTAMASCSKSDQGETPATEEYVNIGIKPTTVEFETSPLLASRGSNDDLYGLQIYELKITHNNKTGEEKITVGDESSYVCWVTDNLAKSSITLRKNKSYMCFLLYIPNGKNLLYKQGNYYGNPFMHLGPNSSPNYDVLHYGSYYDMNFASYGASQTKNKRDYRIQTNFWNQVDIYYGKLRIEATQDGDYQIDLYRMMFGLKIKATNFKKGKLAVFCSQNNDTYEATKANDGYAYMLTPDSPEIDLVLELTGMPWPFDSAGNDFLRQDLKTWACGDRIGIDYIKDTGESIKLIRQDFTTQRMKKYTFELNVEELIDEVENNISPNIVDDEWSDGSIEE